MSGAVLSFCAMAIAARELLARMGVFEILAFRTGIALLIVLAVALPAGRQVLATRRLALHAWRNLTHLGGQWCWVYAIGLLPLATVFAIEFTMPIWVAILAALFLGERLTGGRLTMLALGFAGVLVILRPGLAAVQLGALVALGASRLYAINMIATRQLAATDAPLTVLFWMSVIQTPLAIALAIPGWVAPVARDASWLLLMGVGSYTAHYCLTRAMRVAEAAVVVPVDFMRLPLIAVVGAVFYAEPFDPAVILGAAMIFGGVWLSLKMERSGERGAARPR
jgi:drug/metabolite transporter (DMT)-like permease